MRFFKRVATGAEAGLLAGAGVAVFFLIEDAVQLQPLSTPMALASGLMGVGTPEVDGGTISRLAAFGFLGVKLLAYTVFHFLAFAAVGVVGAFVLKVTSFWSTLLSGAAFGSVACTGLLYGSQLVVDLPVALDVLGVPSVFLVNAMGGAILGLGLHLAHTVKEDHEPS